jgi:hypothetical protein
MGITAKLSLVLRGRMKVAERVSLAVLRIVEIRILVSLPIRICIIQDPALIRQICTVSVDDHYFGRNHFHFIGPILI